MKIKDETEPVYFVDFCRRKDCQQIKVIETNDKEISDFLSDIFKDRRRQGNAKREDRTIVKVRRIVAADNSCKRLMAMPLYNISPSQARTRATKLIKTALASNKDNRTAE